jgi:hypothetical protein
MNKDFDFLPTLNDGVLRTNRNKFAPVERNVNRCVVRVKTTTWADRRGLHTKKSLTFLRRQCEGFNLLEEDAEAIGAEDVVPRIMNLDECEDGIYDVVTCNESRDYETGHIDDYDYMLVPTGET